MKSPEGFQSFRTGSASKSLRLPNLPRRIPKPLRQIPEPLRRITEPTCRLPKPLRSLPFRAGAFHPSKKSRSPTRGLPPHGSAPFTGCSSSRCRTAAGLIWKSADQKHFRSTKKCAPWQHEKTAAALCLRDCRGFCFRQKCPYCVGSMPSNTNVWPLSSER